MSQKQVHACVLAGISVLVAGTIGIAGAPAPKPKRPAPQMSFIDNGVIKLGVDLSLGGAITYLSPSGTDANLINNADYGRQIQMSYYSGPNPYIVGTNVPHEHWKGLGWNPIQTGDVSLTPSKVIAHTNDGKKLYIKCIPMHWPLTNVPGECTFESWVELDGPVAHARCRLNNARPDRTQYRGRHQECPAVYVNGPFYRLMTYSGEQPFSGAPLTRIEKKPEEKGPWASWLATENWAAMVNDQEWGLGVFNPGAVRFIGGFAGKPGKGGSLDGPTCYIAPIRSEILDYNIQHDYRYDLVLGTLADIRKYVYAQPHPTAPPAYRFTNDRQGWYYVNAVDAGWPITGELNITLAQAGPQLLGPEGFWPAAQAPVLLIEAAAKTTQPNGRIYWRTFEARGFDAKKSVPFAVTPNGQFHTYRLNLASQTNYTGIIT